MAVWPLILTVFAFVFFVVSAWGSPTVEPHRFRLVAIGLAFWVLAQILSYSGVLAR